MRTPIEYVSAEEYDAVMAELARPEREHQTAAPVVEVVTNNQTDDDFPF